MEFREIFVDEYLKKDGITKHALYRIKGQIKDEGVNILRRYKDFVYLRRILTFNWPACWIPQIPPKQMIVKLI